MKFNENCWMGSKDMGQTRISKVNRWILNCDLDLESVLLS